MARYPLFGTPEPAESSGAGRFEVFNHTKLTIVQPSHQDGNLGFLSVSNRRQELQGIHVDANADVAYQHAELTLPLRPFMIQKATTSMRR